MNNRDRVYIVDSMNGQSARKRFDNTLSTISHSLKQTTTIYSQNLKLI